MTKYAAAHPKLIEALRPLGIDMDNTLRVIIDIQSGGLPAVWVQLAADDTVLHLVETLGSIDIERK